MSASVFISYASQDAKVANTLCKALEGRGFKCWIASRDIAPGENFQVAIVRAIRAAKIMLLVFTGNSNNSEEMAKELALASQSKLIVVPLRIDDVKPNDAFSYEFATRQWIDFFIDWETAIEQLAQRIAAALGYEPVPVLEPVASAAEPAPPPPPAPPVPEPGPTPTALMAAMATPGVVEAASKPAPTPAADLGPSSYAPTPKRGPPVALFVALGVLVIALIGGAVVILPSFLGPKPPAPAANALNAIQPIATAPVVTPTTPTAGYVPPATEGPVAMGTPPQTGPRTPGAGAASPPPPATPTAGPTGPQAEDIDVDPDTEAQQARHPAPRPRQGRSEGGPVEVPF
jgi:hypothetical protein